MELLQLFNENGEMLNQTVVRGQDVPPYTYIKLSVVYLKCNDKYLFQLTSEQKDGLYAVTGGHVSAGNTSKNQAIIECNEELGLTLDIEKLQFLGSIKTNRAIFDVYLYEDNNLDKQEIILQNEEVENYFWLTEKEFQNLIKQNLVRQSTIKSFEKFLN